MEHLSKRDWQQLLRENRRLFSQSELYRQVKREAAIIEYKTKKDGSPSKQFKIVGHRCANCGKHITLDEKLQVDHKLPVKDGVNRLNMLNRLWCHIDYLQVLCIACHMEKTNKERKK